MPDKAFPILGYRFKDADLLYEALTHASSADHRLKSNERMEFLGDAILGYVICEYLYHEFPDLLEGDMTKIKSAVVSRRVCAKISKEIQLDQLLNLGKGMTGRPGLPSSVAAAVFESIIAAIYLDGGMEAARTFILEHTRPYLDDAATSAHQQNFKSVLQQLSQKQMPCHPAYVLLDEKGPDHAKAFEVCVDIDGRRFPSAWANAKKQAEQRAALNALLELKLARIDQRGAVHLAEPDQIDSMTLAARPDASDHPDREA
jgi:ribonuclease-3